MMIRCDGTESVGSSRLESFTEAVPLSLSSMAHASQSLEEGVLDGVRHVLSHTLLSCVNYARILHPPHQWTFRDLSTSPFAWIPVPVVAQGKSTDDLPRSLHTLGFGHKYSRSALIFLNQVLPPDLSKETELEWLHENKWTGQVGILGRVTLLYVSKTPLHVNELEGVQVENSTPVVLYRVLVEYRSLPPTGNKQAVQAEELSMLSFGGSVDDDVKTGALSSLYDDFAKYVLEVFSVRGKKYKFDLMDSTLSSGKVPRLPSSREGDPFVKCLCTTVTDYKIEGDEGGEMQTEKKGGGQESPMKRKYAVTRMQLTMEGKPRSPSFEDNLPNFDFMPAAITASFLQLSARPPSMVTAMPCGHRLILEPALAGRIYVNGRYVTKWGKDHRIGGSGTALFGMDLHSIPFWHGRITDFEAMKEAYALLWSEVLVDARLSTKKIATRLLYRLMIGYDSVEVEKDLYEGEDSDFDTDIACIESDVLSASAYDRVGIAAKALATRFNAEFGQAAFPCLEHEVEWASSQLPGRKPVVVPHRLLKLLRRGGHFSVHRTVNELWFSEARPPRDGDEKEAVSAAIDLLGKAGCVDVHPDQVVFAALVGVDGAIGKKAVCKYSREREQYCVNERFISKFDEFTARVESGSADKSSMRSYLLGMYIAQEHPNGDVLPRYLLQNQL